MAQHPETIRAFMAFTPPAGVIKEIARLQQGLRQALDRNDGRRDLNIKWTAPNNIHLTVQFLGDITIEEKAAACRAAGQTVQHFSTPISVIVRSLGVFPTMRRPRVVWVGLADESKAIFNFSGLLSENLKNEGFTLEDRPFKAHLTLGRVKFARNIKVLVESLDKFSDFQSKPFYLETFILYKSVLGQQGPTYTRLAEFPLGPPEKDTLR